MVTKASFLTNTTKLKQLEDFLNSRLEFFDIDFSIIKYDYFDINEYKSFTSELSFSINENIQLIEILSDINFSYEIELGTSFSSLESEYLACLNDCFAQTLSLDLQCDTLTFIKSINGDEDCPITHFNCGKVVIDFSYFNIDVWKEVKWIKSS